MKDACGRYPFGGRRRRAEEEHSCFKEFFCALGPWASNPSAALSRLPPMQTLQQALKSRMRRSPAQ